MLTWLSGGGGAPDAGEGRPVEAWLRWVLPAALLGGELALLTLVADFPEAGPAAALVPAVRLALPVVSAAVVSAWMLSRHDASPSGLDALPVPPWRPARPLLAHAAALAVTLALAARLLAPGGPPVSAGAFLAWLACAALAALLAVHSAAPLPWLARRAAQRWSVPLLALGAGLLSWRAMVSAEGLWGGLASGTLGAVAWVLGRVAGDVSVDGAERVVALGSFEVEIAPSCSGVDGVGLILVFLALWIALARSRLRIGRALLLLPIGALAALAGNVLRLSALVWLGAAGHEDLALGAFHSKIGWLIFLAIALGSVALAERLPWLRRPGSPPAGEVGLPAAAGASVAPLLAAIATSLATGTVSGGAVDRAYAARIAVALLVLLQVRRSLARPRLGLSWPAVLLGVGVGVLWVAWPGADGAAVRAEIFALAPGWRVAWITARVIGAVAVVPVVEELAFRGFLLPWIASPQLDADQARVWSWPAALLSSVAFGALHHQWVLGFLAGMAFAAARQLRGRLSDAVLAHAVSNAAVVLAVLLGGRWDLWS